MSADIERCEQMAAEMGIELLPWQRAWLEAVARWRPHHLASGTATGLVDRPERLGARNRGDTMTDNLRQRLTTALAWMGPDYRQAVEDVLAVLEEDA